MKKLLNFIFKRVGTEGIKLNEIENKHCKNKSVKRLLVPFEEKNIAKALGAKWNNEKKTWYLARDQHLHLFKKWLPTFEHPVLYIDFVPESAWYKNLRSELTEEEWQTIKTFVYKRAGYKCEICGGKGDKHPVEAHERWHYDDENFIQTLIGIDALCPSCHLSTHMGLANKIGKLEEAKLHMMKVNQWDRDALETHYHEKGELWEWRSKQKWKLDATWIIDLFMDKLSNKSISKIIKSSLHCEDVLK
jgi:5-methylcytosine-specific restriction endonuclease McrA